MDNRGHIVIYCEANLDVTAIEENSRPGLHAMLIVGYNDRQEARCSDEFERALVVEDGQWLMWLQNGFQTLKL